MIKMISDADIERISGAGSYPTQGQIGFIGPTAGGNKIRAEFTALEVEEITARLADIGDLDVKATHQLGSIIMELAESDDKTIVCTSPYRVRRFDQQFWKSFINPVIVSNKPIDNCDDLYYIGLQRHLYTKGFKYEAHRHLRLGEIRSNLEQAEVILRNADCVMLDLGVLRFADNIGSHSSSTAGLMIEELCMVAKYAGASTGLRTIIIHGYDQNQDDHKMMAKNVALVLYYILDGHDILQRELEQSEQLQKYTILPDHCSQELVFVEDQRSGRWWVEMYSDGAQKDVKMACTRKDYEDACNNLISERLTNLMTLA